MINRNEKKPSISIPLLVIGIFILCTNLMEIAMEKVENAYELLTKKERGEELEAFSNHHLKTHTTSIPVFRKYNVFYG